MAFDPTLPGAFDGDVLSFSNANGLRAQILVDVSPADPARGLNGGCRLLDATVSSNEASASRTLQLIKAKQTTLAAAMGTIGITATTNSTVTRSAGSFITDGYRIGDLAMCFGTTNNANEGLIAQVSSVAAGTLTFNGTTGLPNAETPGANFRIFRISPLFQTVVLAGSGVDPTKTSVSLIGAGGDGSQDRAGFWLGPLGAYIVGVVGAAVSATAGTYVSVDYRRALY